MSHWIRVLIEDAMDGQRQLPEHVRSGLKRVAGIMEASDVTQFRTQEFESIADEISFCSELSELSRLLWRATTSIGFQHFCLFVIKQGDEPGFGSRLCTSYSKEWLKRYEKERYQFVDPIYTCAEEKDGHFLFSEIKSESPLVQDFWRELDSYRIGRNGICFALTRPSGARLGVSFSSGGAESKVRETIRLNKHDLSVIARLAIECFCQVSANSDLTAEALSTNELRFLHMLATNPHPEKALLVTPNFGGNKALQTSIRNKLNVETVFQAIAIASSMRWFDSLPYNYDEAIRPFPELKGLDVKADAKETISIEGQ
ncbi:autoinducer binding domain-containing protein [Roseobacter sp. EG26]